VTDTSRLESLRRRVQQDPSSIAFAQLAEEYRRAGQLQESVDTCRAGLDIHPAYHSARVTLGRALLELHQFDEAQRELEQVVKHAPDNLAAIRALAEALKEQGSFGEALAQYRAALAIARHDPDLEQMVSDLGRRVEVQAPAPPVAAQDLRSEAEHAEVSSAPLEAGLPIDEAAERGKARARATIAALEQWLHAVHVARAQRCA